MNLRIPKQRVDVQICDDRGRIHRGGIFLDQSMSEDRPPQRVQDLLKERRFVPVQEGDGVWFIQRARISWIRMSLFSAVKELDPAVEQSDKSVESKVVLEFVDGSSIRGVLRYLRPESACRVSDYIEQSVGFIPVRTPDDLYLVNLDRVVRLLLEGGES
jgi:hypothetical protein